jgi:hypothetical protein
MSIRVLVFRLARTTASGAMLVALTTSGCSSPTRPSQAQPGPTSSPAPGSPPAAVSARLIVTDGWTGTPVGGARVETDAFSGVTDPSGVLGVTVSGGCTWLDVEASGYLHRGTKVCGPGGGITLWPVSSQAETDATRDAAFVSDRSNLHLRSQYPLLVGFSDELSRLPDVVGIWQDAARRLQDLGADLISVSPDNHPTDDGLVIARAEAPPRCASWFQWDITVAGFCLDSTQYYFVHQVKVPSELLDSPDVALRVLLYTTLLGLHDMPGTLNRSHPDAAVSPFEQKTLRMMQLRRAKVVTWPDIDPR